MHRTTRSEQTNCHASNKNKWKGIIERTDGVTTCTDGSGSDPTTECVRNNVYVMKAYGGVEI